MSSISAGTTTTTGYVVSSDTTGSLVLKTGASATTAVTVDTSQRLLAGLSSNLSGARLQVQGATDSAFTALSINAATNDGYMGIGYSSSGSVWQIWPTYNATAGYKPLAFVVGGSEVARFPTASGFQCVNSISVGNATPTTSGAGITFPATQSASSDANTLDDYEEGTFTPTLGGTATYTLQTGRYTKIGALVHVSINLVVNSIGTGTTTTMSGLPFTPAGGSTQAGYTNWFNSIASSQIYIFPRVVSGDATIYFAGITASSTQVNNSPTLFGSSAQIEFSIVYRAS